jgi:methanogenic corrinoid protein MtbC1
MNHTRTRSQLISAIAELQENQALALVRRRLADGEDPPGIMEDCQEGMRRVGERYEREEYFLAGLIMAGEIFRQVMQVLQPVVRCQVSGRVPGKVLLGTVQGDIHDLGKNIVSMLLSCHEFTVYDLGVDVPPAEFVRQAGAVEPDIVGLSGLLTTSYDSMRQAASALRAAGVRAPIIAGGGQLNEQVFHYIGADHWTTDAIAGVDLCRRLAAGAA